MPVLAAAVAVAVYGHGLAALPLWRDEVASVDIAARPIPAIVAAAGRIDVVHTAYYLLLHGVLAIGDSVVWVRLPSLLAMVAAVAIVAGLAQRRAGVLAAVVAVALLVANPWLADYAREARPYAIATALVCAAAAVVLGGRPTGRRTVAFTVLAVTASWMHLFDALPLLGLVAGRAVFRRWHPVGSSVVPHRRRRDRTTSVCVLGAAVALAPLVVVAVREQGQVSWVQAPTGADVRQLLADATGTAPGQVALAAVALVLLLRLARAPLRHAAHPVDGVREVPAGCASGVAQGERPASLLGAALLAAAVGPAVLLGLSWAGHPVYVERYVLPSAPLLALAAGAAVRLLPGGRPGAAGWGAPGGRAVRLGGAVRGAGGRGFAAAAVGLAALTGVPAAAAGPADKTEDLRAGADHLAAAVRSGDCVAYRPGWARVGFAYYLHTTRARPADVALDAGRPVVGLFPDELPLDTVETHLLACRRVWVVGYPGPVGRWRPVPEVTGAALAAVGPRFTQGGSPAFGDLTVVLWTARSP